jgi:ATP/maltotriose-dependent transcriptional regulator MalT
MRTRLHVVSPKPRGSALDHRRTGGSTGRLITRAELLERLDRSRLARVSLLQGPAGYGKSTLLAQWSDRLAAQGIDAVVLPLDESLAAHDRFFAALRRAMATAAGTGKRPGRESSDRRRPPALESARELAASLRAHVEPLVIVLDDYQRVAGDELDAALGEFLRAIPATVHVVISSRPPVAIPLAHLQLEARVARLDVKDLRFSDAEIADLFDQSLMPEELAMLSVWTEGWPVAVQLARAYLEACPDRRAALGHLSAQTDQAVGGYLTEQILARLSAEDRDLLVRTSFLDSLDPDVVEAVTGTLEAWRPLERLANSCVLVRETDDCEGAATYRCHHLLREILYSELRKRGREEVSRVRARAAAWFRSRGRLDEALRQGRAAQDHELVASIVLEMGGILYGVIHGSHELRHLLSQIPPGVLTRYPRLLLAQAFDLIKEGRMDAAQDVIRGVRATLNGDLSVEPLLLRDLSLAEVAIACYSGTTTLEASHIALLQRAVRDAGPEDDLGRGLLNTLLAATYYQGSEFSSATAAGEAALYHFQQLSSPNGVAHCHVHLGLICLEQGRTEPAFAHWRQAKSHFDAGDITDQSGSALATVLMAEALYEMGDLAGARSICEAAVGTFENGEPFYPAYLSAYRTLSGIALLQDGLARSLAVLDAAARTAGRRRLAGEIERFIALRRVEVQLQAGAFSRLSEDTGGRLQAGWNGPAHDAPRAWYETDYQTLFAARLALQDGDFESAIAQLTELDQSCLAQGRVRTRISILIILAAAYHAARRREPAIAAMRQAIALSARGPSVRAFLEDSRLAMPLLIYLGASGAACGVGPAEMTLIERLLGMLQGRGVAGELLFSSRELEILQQLVLNNNNKLIARALGVTPDTVRFHLKKIYEKLGVSDRKVVRSLIVERGLLRSSPIPA